MANTSIRVVPPGTAIAPRRNLSSLGRGTSLIAGSCLGVMALNRRGPGAVALGLLSSLLVMRGVTGAAPVKRLVGQKPDEIEVARKEGWSGAAVLSRSVTINAPRHAVYSRFRDLSRWPEWALNVEAIDAASDDCLHFVTKGPAGDMRWVARITQEQEGALLALAAAEDAAVPMTMRYTFRDAPGKRGTEIQGVIAYEPPGGGIVRQLAKLTEREPGIQLRRDLKRFKSLLETGEIAVNSPQGPEPKA